MQIPKPRHALRIDVARNEFVAYSLKNPGRIHLIAGGGECKITIADLESERHPDLGIYMSPMPEDENPWAVWVPDILIEVVSSGSKRRDYKEKPDEYLRFGVREYWIIDAEKREMLVLRRSRGPLGQADVGRRRSLQHAALAEIRIRLPGGIRRGVANGRNTWRKSMPVHARPGSCREFQAFTAPG